MCRAAGSAGLGELIEQRFTPEGKAEGVARAILALYQEEPFKLTPGEWKWVAEDAGLGEQS